MRDRILALVKSEGLRPGDQIPTEAELGIRFGGSRPMIREALKLLEQDGVVDVKHGRGRFLTATGVLNVHRPITRFESITEMGQALGLQYDNRVLSVSEERPSKEIARTLGLAAGEGVIRLERLRLHRKEPLIYGLALIRRSVVPDRLYEVDWSGSLLDLLESYGSRPRMSVAKVRALTLPPDVVERNDLRDFGPALVIEETAYNLAGDPVIWASDYHRGSHFAFDFVRK
ncbi:GntR family transcriptional regulator [Rubellimicrobium mesophilum]|nr:GntR family transcriptional regulator [Rubellimicrobium mesophilum]